MGHITALGVALKHFEILELKAATAGRKPISQSDYANSLPMGIVDFFQEELCPWGPRTSSQTCLLLAGPRSHPTAGLWLSSAPRGPPACFPGSLQRGGWPNKLGKPGSPAPALAHHRLQLWFPGAGVTPSASVTQADGTQSGSAQSRPCPAVALGTRSQPPTPRA